MEKVKVVWAFDPYSDTQDAWQGTIGLLDQLKDSNRELIIHPIYVLGQEMVHWVANITPPKLDLVQPKILEVMTEKINSLKRNDIAQPKVLISDGFNSRDDIDTFSEELKKIQPDLVVLNTHQRKGMTRWFMGSFTENFLLKCQFPALVIPPNMKLSKKIIKTLIPSSLKDKEKVFFNEFVSGKMGIKTDVILYSKIFHPIDTFASSAITALGGSWVSLEAFSQEVVVDRLKKGEEWGAEAKKQGVSVKVKVDDSPKDFAENLLQVAQEEDVQLIALPSFSGKTEAVLLGSNAREIVRQSPLPVLVRHYSNS
ncbi:MAG: universal stress protein [Bdellovibrionaceae bacterium]|nr:universal stress protein [Pseudobdellovibrionaceae bacterium]